MIERIGAATQKVIALPAIQERLAAIGAEAVGGTPEQFAAYIREDFAKWTQIVKDANVKVE